MPPEPADEALDLFAQFLDRTGPGGEGDIDALCAEHPDHAQVLRDLHRDWLAVNGTLTVLAASKEDVSSSVAVLLSRLESGTPRIARYTLGSEIATGAMGRIVRAWDGELRREVAIKFLRARARGVRAQRRFLEEAQITGQLDHPGIVPIHELGLDEHGRPFFTMKLVRGRDLGVVIQLLHDGDAEWTRARVIGVLLRVCEAMAFAHDKGVVHRDLKPSNIMVGRFGETYVMDWGLARVRDGAIDDGEVDTLRADIAGEDDVSPSLTRDGDVVGSPPYMAPEQAAGLSGTIDPRVDVYSIGAILYHVLSGRAPYEDSEQRSGVEVVAAVRSGPPKPLPIDVPVELRAICERAMARAPDDRYARVEDLGRDLRAFLELRVVHAYATGRFAELRKWVARNRALSASAVALVLAIVVFAAVASRLWVAAARDRERADRTAGALATELERSRFKSARQALQLGDWINATAELWQQYFTGAMPRSTSWALRELVMRTPSLVTRPVVGNLPIAFVPRADAIAVGMVDGDLAVCDRETLATRSSIAGGSAPLTMLAAVPGTTRVFTGDAQGIVRRCELDDPRGAAVVVADGARSIAVSADGLLAIGDGAGQVRTWTGSGEAAGPLVRLPAAITVLGFDPKGLLLFAADADGHAVVHELDSGVDHPLELGHGTTTLSFAPSGKEVWVGESHSIAIVDLHEFTVRRVMPTRNGTCRSIAHESEDSVLVGGWWRIDRYRGDGERVEAFAQRGIWRFALDPGARRLAVSSGRFGLALFDTSGGARRSLSTRAVAMTSDGRAVAGYSAGEVTVREVAEWREICRVPSAGGVQSMALSRDGRRFAQITAAGMRVQVFDVPSARQLLDTEGPRESPMFGSILLSQDGATLDAVIGWDGVRHIDVSTGAILAEHHWPDREVLRIAVGPRGTVAVMLRYTQRLQLWDPHLDAVTEIVIPDKVGDDPSGSLSAVDVSADGRTMVVGTWAGYVFVCDLVRGGLRTIKADAGTIWSVALFRDDPGLLLTSGGSNGVALWDLDDDTCCHQMLQDDAPVGCVSLSDDGRTLAATTGSGAVVLDLAYWQRHVAYGLEPALAALPPEVRVAPQRLVELRASAARVLAEPWPRWGR
ncbi:MAG: serine/threonine-protein kinase [Planctomycetota bacterium]